MLPITGRLISAAVIAILVLDAGVNLLAPHLIRQEMAAVQFPANLAPVLGAIMLACAVLYALPATSFVGAILVTGFLGGAICLHLRAGEELSPPQLISLALGIATWAGLYFREPRLRDLVLRRGT
ncbi:DoxX family protein [Ancylobacter oerskovii]|uniref:DoxX family protein n=1 Tax=Ancylobacter oerskovii TaxID=459519 RepID=A0ABW4YWH7_9HYPH|nr:DoxX family protein [Ancylobacter oerskovii]MBS7544183.1 DoxX family protein [Ancylobacter oerskovii]